MGLKHIVMTLIFALAPALLLPAGVQAQTNSRQAIEAARKHRAEQGDAQRAPATRFAAIEIPIPDPQTTTPRSTPPEATFCAQARPKSG